MCVAIVTDDMEQSKKILERLNSYFLQNGVYTDFEAFDTNEALLYKAREKLYHTVVLQTANSGSLAEKMHRINKSCKIIFSKANKEDVINSYDIGIAYCCDDIMQADLSKILTKYREETK